MIEMAGFLYNIEYQRILEGVLICVIGSAVVGFWPAARRRLRRVVTQKWNSLFLVIDNHVPVILTRHRYKDLLQEISEQGDIVVKLRDEIEKLERALNDEKEVAGIYSQEIFALRSSIERLNNEQEELKDDVEDDVI